MRCGGGGGGVGRRCRRLSGVPLIVTCAVCLSVSVVCHIVALSTRRWLTATASSSDGGGAATTAWLSVGLWQACFGDFLHRHELPPRLYDGCHSLHSRYYDNIRQWLVPRTFVCHIYSTLCWQLL